jgi:hypothetical protein
MRRLLTWLAGGLGAAALGRQLLRRRPAGRPTGHPGADPAEELRAKLEQARRAPGDRDEFDAAEGTPLDEVEAPRPAAPRAEAEAPPDAAPEAEEASSLEERRRRVHDKAQEALGQMRGADED